MPLLHYDPADCNDSSLKHGLGQKAWFAGSPSSAQGEYQYVQFEDAVTYAAGQHVWWDDADGFEVTNDESSAEADWVTAGFCMRVMTTTYYGWILKRGYHAAAVKKAGDDSLVPGEQMIPDYATPTDGTIVSYLCDPGTPGDPSDAELQELQRACVFSTIQVAGNSTDAADTVPIFCDLI